MKLKLTILLIFISLFSFAQQLKITSQKFKPTKYRSGTYANQNTGSYYSVTGDSIYLNSFGSSWNGVIWTYTKQRKDICRLSVKYKILRRGSTTTQMNLGCQVWKGGVRQNINMAEFANYATTGSNYFNYTTYTDNISQYYTKFIDINFANLPQYDSLTFHLSYYMTTTASGTGAYVSLNKNDYTIKPLRNVETGITKYNANLFGFNSMMWMPDTFYMTQGTSMVLYNENIAYVGVNYKNRIHFDWTSQIGMETDTSLRIKAINTGNYTATVYAKDRNNIIRDFATTVIKVEPKYAIGSCVILPIGNSLTFGGWNYMKAIIDDTLNVSLTSIGTINPGYRQEGHSGWKYSNFISVGSPFWYGGKFDMKQYLTTNSFVEPNVVRLSLGINECYQKIPTTTTITNATTLIDSILSQSNAKIIIVMPSSASDTYSAWDSQYSSSPDFRTHTDYDNYIKAIMQLNKTIHNKFAYGRYNNRVSVGYDAFVIDRNSGYPKTAGVHTNALHPSTTSATGYKALIKGTMNLINHINQ